MLGNSFWQARKKAGLTQEVVAEKLGVSRQTISKWETNETVPDIYQAKELAGLYNLKLDELVEVDDSILKIEDGINSVDERKVSKTDWTKVWSKKYPILASYQEMVDSEEYAHSIRIMLNKLMKEYGFNEVDSMLVLKDILYHEWKDKR